MFSLRTRDWRTHINGNSDNESILFPVFMLQLCMKNVMNLFPVQFTEASPLAAVMVSITLLHAIKPRLSYKAHDKAVFNVALLSDGRIITSSYDKTIMVWRGLVCEQVFKRYSRFVNEFAMLPDGNRFISVSSDETATLFNLDGDIEWTIDTELSDCIAVFPDGTHFVVGTEDDKVHLYRIDGTLVHTFQHTLQGTPTTC